MMGPGSFIQTEAASRLGLIHALGSHATSALVPMVSERKWLAMDPAPGQAIMSGSPVRNMELDSLKPSTPMEKLRSVCTGS